jgi:hypothetical protein
LLRRDFAARHLPATRHSRHNFTRRFCRNEQLLKEAMGTAPVKDAPFSRDHGVEVDLANSLLHVDQLLQLPPAAAASEASCVVAAGRLVLGKWVPVAPDIAHDIITRSAALKTGQFKSVNL